MGIVTLKIRRGRLWHRGKRETRECLSNYCKISYNYLSIFPSVSRSCSLAKFVSDDIKTSAIHMYDNVDKRSQYILRLASTTGNKSFLPMLKAMYIEGVSKNEQTDGKEQRDKKDSNSEADMIKKKFKEEGETSEVKRVVSFSALKGASARERHRYIISIDTHIDLFS